MADSDRRWVLIVPVDQLYLTEAVDREFRVDRVRFVDKDKLPRVRKSTAGEGHERRYFYGSVWAVAVAQPVLWILWKTLPMSAPFAAVKLVAFVTILAAVGWRARLGLLPRTRPIVPGELAVSD